MTLTIEVTPETARRVEEALKRGVDIDALLQEALAEEWDRQIEADAKAGKLDHLINKAREVYKSERTREI